MTPIAIGSAVAAVFVGAILALLLASRRAARDGAWRAVRPVSGGEPVMRRWNGRAWETRAMTDEELADFLSREAW